MKRRAFITLLGTRPPASRGSPSSGANFFSAGGEVRAARGMWLSDLYPKGYSQTRLSTVIVFANSSRGKPRCRFCFGCQRFLWGHFSSWRRSPVRVQNDPWQGKLLTCGGAATRRSSGIALSVITSISKNMVVSTGCCGLTKDWCSSRLARQTQSGSKSAPSHFAPWSSTSEGRSG
jgi:hypothetical protein